MSKLLDLIKETLDMGNLIDLTAGDWSSDGHGMTTTCLVACNVGLDELKIAHDIGAGVIGINLSELCSDSEDDHIPTGLIATLEEHGIHLEYEDDYPESKDYKLLESPDEFARLYLEIAKLGDPSIHYEVLNLPTVNIGGYGLFRS
jgi:hypothetical protein